MTTTDAYPAKLMKDEDGRYLVTFPDIPEALTDGATIEDALTEAVDCLEEAMAGRINRDEDIPAASKSKRGQYLIPLAAHFAMKVLLHCAWKEAGITRTQLAERMEVDEKEARRLLDPHYGSKLPKMEQAFDALGYRVNVGLEKVA
jgi:antitoxin HicB